MFKIKNGYRIGHYKDCVNPQKTIDQLSVLEERIVDLIRLININIDYGRRHIRCIYTLGYLRSNGSFNVPYPNTIIVDIAGEDYTFLITPEASSNKFVGQVDLRQMENWILKEKQLKMQIEKQGFEIIEVVEQG